MMQWRKTISFDFHHIPKLSIGFKISSTISSGFKPTQIDALLKSRKNQTFPLKGKFSSGTEF